MKIILTSISVILASSAAIAAPHVGDYAKYQFSVTMLGQTTVSTIEASITAFDPVKNQFTELLLTKYQDGTQNEVGPATVNAADVTTGYQTIASCLAKGGKLEDVTVPAGTFHACVSVDSNGLSTWVADGLSSATDGVLKVSSSMTNEYGSYSLDQELLVQTFGQ